MKTIIFLLYHNEKSLETPCIVCVSIFVFRSLLYSWKTTQVKGRGHHKVFITCKSNNNNKMFLNKRKKNVSLIRVWKRGKGILLLGDYIINIKEKKVLLKNKELFLYERKDIWIIKGAK